MELDQDLLNLWLQAERGLSTGQARQLIELVQDSRNASMTFSYDTAQALVDEGKEWLFELGEQWGLDLQTPISSADEKLGNYELVYVGACPGREAWRAQSCS